MYGVLSAGSLANDSCRGRARALSPPRSPPPPSTVSSRDRRDYADVITRVHSYVRLVKPRARNWSAADKRVKTYVCTCVCASKHVPSRPEGPLTSASPWLVVYEPIKQTRIDRESRHPPVRSPRPRSRCSRHVHDCVKIVGGSTALSPRIKLVAASRARRAPDATKARRVGAFQHPLRYKRDVNAIEAAFYRKSIF